MSSVSSVRIYNTRTIERGGERERKERGRGSRGKTGGEWGGEREE
jgi:hypothetical protein